MTSFTAPVPVVVAGGGSSLLLREALAALLRTAPGVAAIVAGEGSVQVASLGPTPSVVLWHVTAGDELLNIARELKSACPPQSAILLLGPLIDGGSLAEVLRAGANGYISSDATPAELIALVRQAARGEPALSSKVAVALLAHLAGGLPSEPSQSLALTEREMEVLRLVASGATNKQIAQQLYLSVRTVEGHLAKLYAKLGVNSRTEAALAAIRRGWVAP